MIEEQKVSLEINWLRTNVAPSENNNIPYRNNSGAIQKGVPVPPMFFFLLKPKSATFA